MAREKKGNGNKSEEMIKASESDFQLMVSEVKDYAIIMLDPGGRVATWNEGAKRIKQYRPEEIIGQHFSRFYTKKDIEAGKPEEELRVAADQGRFEDEAWRVRKDGSQFVANFVITALRDKAGKLKGFAKITRDVTEKKAAEKELKDAQERVVQAANEILEVSTPIVTAFDDILTLPIIGTLDSERTQRIMESLLQAVVDTQSRVVIIDVTGVSVMDTLTAAHLLKTAEAVRLLGATAIVTGISPVVAQTLVQLGVDLSSLMTRSRMIEGMKAAFKLLGKKVVEAE